jgi:hypothetical protein
MSDVERLRAALLRKITRIEKALAIRKDNSGT